MSNVKTMILKMDLELDREVWMENTQSNYTRTVDNQPKLTKMDEVVELIKLGLKVREEARCTPKAP